MCEFLCAAILFDLDGVLVDSTPAIIQVWTAWAASHRIDPNNILSIMHGRRSVEVLQIIAPQVDAPAEVEKIEQAITSFKNGTVPVPGAADLLRSLPQDRWAVATSGMRVFAKARLQAAGLPVPEVLVAADDVGKGKPDPEPYLKAAELLKIEPAQCLVIEDAPAGIRAAHAGGMKAIGLATTYPPQELREADYVIKVLGQIAISFTPGQMICCRFSAAPAV
jgi:mannitol-1-/sugar-/sorbitol-6-phosphatase